MSCHVFVGKGSVSAEDKTREGKERQMIELIGLRETPQLDSNSGQSKQTTNKDKTVFCLSESHTSTTGHNGMLLKTFFSLSADYEKRVPAKLFPCEGGFSCRVANKYLFSKTQQPKCCL